MGVVSGACWPSSGLLDDPVIAEGMHGVTCSGRQQDVLLALLLPLFWPLLGLLGGQSSPVHRGLSPLACRVSRALWDGRHVARLWGRPRQIVEEMLREQPAILSGILVQAEHCSRMAGTAGHVNFGARLDRWYHSRTQSAAPSAAT